MLCEYILEDELVWPPREDTEIWASVGYIPVPVDSEMFFMLFSM